MDKVRHSISVTRPRLMQLDGETTCSHAWKQVRFPCLTWVGLSAIFGSMDYVDTYPTQISPVRHLPAVTGKALTRKHEIRNSESNSQNTTKFPLYNLRTKFQIGHSQRWPEIGTKMSICRKNVQKDLQI
jgi:hypothetical protein